MSVVGGPAVAHNVLVSHADEPIGRRVVKALVHDRRIGNVLGVGEGPAPRGFDRFIAASPPRFFYARVDLAKHRSCVDFFHSSRFREAAIDTLVHIPRHASRSEGPPVVSGLPVRTAEARLVLQHALEAPSIRSLVALGSAFVYRLAPGNANRLSEDSELNLDPEVPAELRSWIDCDMIFHGELGGSRLRVVLLRVPTVVASGGYVYWNPSLAGPPGPRLRPLGFDPMCALVCDKDAAKAVQAAVHASASGVFNVAGRESVPLSVLGAWTGRPGLPLPGPALRTLATAARWLRRDSWRSAADGAELRYGFTLDTRRAERELGFRPQYHVGLARAGDGRLRLETSPA
jgi:nucleoside-diphosphate-sugar epimerase